eukprot:CAMPEP_0177783206 /NCGR_PEP_ID=MMETSP0491_2-20121128/18959_1 /TAXON_ID=63592 /ORGANISM="Tetraselmis chuii, Strain PLY429" /LENGTH=211 /DNA_ID=CAMNT_0019303721 /DNA_START=219 /DNA_END=854 /DNA_ORIENTATION=+
MLKYSSTVLRGGLFTIYISYTHFYKPADCLQFICPTFCLVPADYQNATKVKGPEYSYTDATRARLFRELLPEVDGLLGMQWLMRWNDYSIDPISNGNPVRAIAARGDLKPPVNGKSHAFGATDSKVSSWRLAEVGQVAAHAIAGPTREQQPMFCWSDADYSESHFGHPECFNMTHLAVPKSVHLPLAAGLNKFSLLNIHQAAAFEEAKAAY